MTKDIIIIADNAKQAKKIAQQKYPANWLYVRKDVVYGSYQYTFTVNLLTLY